MLFKVAALLLILSAGVCIAQDIDEALFHKDKLAQNQSCADDPSGTDCFCCCAHVLPESVCHAEPQEHFSPVPPPLPKSVVDLPPARILRPPRAA